MYEFQGFSKKKKNYIDLDRGKFSKCIGSLVVIQIPANPRK